MVKKITSTTPKEEILDKIQAVEICKPVSKNEISSFISVCIGNCKMIVTNQTDLKLLKKISEAFDND